jgi:hypothetical protein
MVVMKKLSDKMDPSGHHFAIDCSVNSKKKKLSLCINN